MKNVFVSMTDEKIEEFKTHPYFAELRKNILEKAETYMTTNPTRIRFSDIHLVVSTGNRYIFENIQGEYYDRMVCLYNAYMLTEDDKYIEPLADIIWNVCDLESWTIPAHISEQAELNDRRCSLDLVSTLIGALVSEVLFFVGDKLPELVYRRAHANVRERIIDTFARKKDEEIYWFHRDTNWSAVCIRNVAACFFLLAEDDEIKPQIPRFLKSMDCYLSGLDDEGCCIEGYSYWGYGFGHFCSFALMLRCYTDGEIDLFKKEKVHAAALFQQKIAMNDHQCLAFADAGLGFAPGAVISHTLKHEYDDVEIPSIKSSTYPSTILSNHLLQRPELENSVFKPKSHNFINAQWFVHHGEKYSLGAKAGHNAETHNHNDVGSFLVSKDNELTFLDPGAGEYTAGYFGRDRYKLFVCSSRGHSVPVINGEYQFASSAKSVVYEQTDSRFSFNMCQAYPGGALKELKRTFDCQRDYFTLSDEYVFTDEPKSVEERFVSLSPIELTDNGARSGKTEVEYDKALYDEEVQTEIIDRPLGKKQTAYILSLKVKKSENNMCLTFKFI